MTEQCRSWLFGLMALISVKPISRMIFLLA